EPVARGLARFESGRLITAFAVQLVQRLREQDRAVTPALRWLDQRLKAQGTTSDDIVRVEHQRQAAMNVTVRNVIMSMGLMSALDWTEFFESVSLVDGVLQADPGYAAMDFATRDSYRHAIEELARGSRRSELEVAREVLVRAAAFPASDLAIALLNRVVTALLRPGALPRLELRDGVPPALRTMVVVPTLLTRPAEVEEQIERLEVHYLANSDGDVRFAL